MGFEVNLDRIIDRESGIVNLGTLFELSERERQRKPTLTVAPRRTPPSFIFPQPTSSTAMVLRGKAPLSRTTAQARRLSPALRALFQGAKRRPAALNRSNTPAITVNTVTGTGSRVQKRYDLKQTGSRTVRIPCFLDRYISALALKQFAGMADDTLFRKRGSNWEVVQDNEVIDLLNPNVVLSLGTVTLLS